MTAENDASILLERTLDTARRTPLAPAYHMTGQPTCTYEQLWTDAGILARRIEEHAAPGMPLIVLGHKSHLMIAAFLACMRTGHAYVPVDAELPAARVADIAAQLDNPLVLCAEPADADVRAALCRATLLDAVAETSAARAAGATAEAPDAFDEAERASWLHGDDTQYIIFTSGSTGKPKGIEVSVSNVNRFAAWMTTFPVVRAGGACFLDQAPYSFDLSVYQLVGALATGGCLHAVPSRLTGDHAALFADIRTAGVHVWVSTPSFADLCLVDPGFDRQVLPATELFLFCGETLHHRTARTLAARFAGAAVANTYGPTESTVAITYVEITDAHLENPQPLPVGAARPGTELRIVDPESGAPVEPGSSGEIVIAGDTVAKGYYRRPDLTAAAFFDTVLSDGTATRAFRTGDGGHLDEDGMLHYEGRLDLLVKMNGFRIELGDVESNLTALPEVSQAAVVPVERAGRVRSLRAFVVPTADALDEPTDPEQLTQRVRDGLASRVPAYMMPRTVCLIDRMPLNANGKVDRAALKARGV
ncbi:D-alanine--poly(phosphoribitol) ligase subunit DltA [Eggerthellaceae bacterium zg-997]|nr:D-alanine--poly(phosphoribitol) ligase subunit DltA [Eggerthellaceae bacterium zg-997]